MKKTNWEGWQDSEIRKAKAILEKDTKPDVHFAKIVFWSALVVTIFGNVVVSFILIPFLIVLNQFLLYAIIILLAGSLGFLYNLLISDIDILHPKHHVTASIVIPLFALSNFFITVFVANRFITDLEINNIKHNPWMVGLVFIIAFILPYVVDQIRIHARHKVIIK